MILQDTVGFFGTSVLIIDSKRRKLLTVGQVLKNDVVTTQAQKLGLHHPAWQL